MVVTLDKAHTPGLKERTSWKHISTVLRRKLYPSSPVAPGFDRYYLYSMLLIGANAFGTTISTQALLKGFFLESTPLTWMLKDIFPQLLSSAVIGRIGSFDSKSRFWYVFAVVSFQWCVLLEFVIAWSTPGPLYLFLGGIVVAFGKSVSFLVSGISRASFHQHFATHQNLGEVTKCFNSGVLVVYTLTSALGLAFGSFVTAPALQFTAVVAACALSVFAGRKSVEGIHSRLLTKLSAAMIAREFVRSGFVDIPTPSAVADQVGIKSELPPPPPGTKRAKVLINPPLTDGQNLDKSFGTAIVTFRDVLHKQVFAFPYSGDSIALVFEKDCSVRHAMFGVLFAEVVVQSCGTTGVVHPEAVSHMICELPAHTTVWEERLDALFSLMERRGWDFTSHCIDQVAMRVTFA